MSSALSGAPVKAVKNVTLSDGHLSWVCAGATERIGVDEILFIFADSQSDGPGPEFWICCVNEDPEDSEKRYKLSLLRAKAVPAEALRRYALEKFPTYLQNGTDNDVDVIVSTKSGTGLALQLWTAVLQPLWQLIATHLGRKTTPEGHYRLTVTQSAEDIRNFARNMWALASQDSKARTIVLLSGDGGVVDLLHGSEQDAAPATLPLMALLPLGTGNALFHSSHKPLYSAPGPTPLVHGIRTLFQGVSANLPIFRASFSPGSHIVTFTDKSKGTSQPEDASQFQKKEVSVSHLKGAIVASYGFHASIVYESDTPDYRVHGNKRFGMVAQELLKESHPYGAQVAIRRSGSVEFEPIPRDIHAYVLTALVSNLERTFAISPATQPLQRQLRLVHFAPLGGERTMDVMMKAYDGGKHVNMEWDDGEKIGYEEVDEVQVTTQEEDERWRVVCIDGTVVQLPKGGQMSVSILEKPLLKVLASPRVIDK